jgi:hypothetical protein
MVGRPPSLLALLCAVLLAPLPALGEGPNGATAASLMNAQSREVRVRLANEGVVLLDSGDGDAKSLVEALVLFEAPIEQTWDLLIQGQRQGEYRDDLQSLETISRDEHGSLDEHHLKIMFVKLVYRLHYDFDHEHWRIHWALAPDFDNGLEEVSGSWSLYELESGRTLAHFGTQVRVGRALPAWLQDSVTRKRVPETLRRCRLWVDSGGIWRP